METSGGGRGAGTGGEIGVQGVQQRFGAAARRRQGSQNGLHEIDQGGPIPAEDAIHQQVTRVQDVLAQVESMGEVMSLAGFFVGPADAVGA